MAAVADSFLFEPPYQTTPNTLSPGSRMNAERVEPGAATIAPKKQHPVAKQRSTLILGNPSDGMGAGEQMDQLATIEAISLERLKLQTTKGIKILRPGRTQLGQHDGVISWLT